MNELALFAGGGGGILGGLLLEWRTRCAVEIDPYARRVLLARQRDGIFPPFPIWDDIRTFDGNPWRGRINVISGGFPCQDISAAGKGSGITGERSGLWKHMARIAGEVRPQFVFVENSPMLVHRGLHVVIGDLASMGYDASWCVLGARHVGALHKRDRLWILANSKRDKQPREESCGGKAGRMGRFEQSVPWNEPPESALSRIRGMDDGMARRVVERTDCIRNGQVPAVARLAWNTLMDTFK